MQVQPVRNPLDVVQVKTSVGSLNVHRNYATRKDSYTMIQSFNAQGSLTNMFSGQYAEFKLSGAAITFVRKVFLQLQIVNNSNTSCTLVPSPLLISYYQTLLSGGNQVEQAWGENLWFNTMSTANENETQTIAGMNNFTSGQSVVSYSSSGSTGQVGGTGGSVDYVIPLPTVLERCGEGIPLTYLPNENAVTFRIYFTSNPFASNSAMTTTSNLQILSAQILVMGERLGPASRASLDSLLRSAPLVSSCYVCDRQIINLGSSSIAAGTQQNSVITAFGGRYAFIAPFLRKSGATQEGLIAFNYSANGTPSDYVMASPQFGGSVGITLFNGAGSPVWTPGLDYKITCLGMSLAYVDTPYFNTFINTNLISASDSPTEAILDGLRTGEWEMDTSFYLQYSNKNTLSNGAELVVLGMRLIQVFVNPDGTINFRTT